MQHDVELTDPRGRTPLELAVSLGHLESVRVLLRHNANVGRENANGWTGTRARGPSAAGGTGVWEAPSAGVGAGGARLRVPRAPVLQEAVSTGDPEMVQLVLQYRDYQRATRRLAGIPELLSKLRRVRHCPGVGSGWASAPQDWGATSLGAGRGSGEALDPPRSRQDLRLLHELFFLGDPLLILPYWAPTQDPTLPGPPDPHPGPQ